MKVMNSYEDYTFGELLRGFRKRQGFTQTELAEALEVSRITISHWERSEFLPRYRDQVIQLQDILALSDEEANQLLTAAYYPGQHSINGMVRGSRKLVSPPDTKTIQPEQATKPTQTWLDTGRNLLALFFFKKGL